MHMQIWFTLSVDLVNLFYMNQWRKDNINFYFNKRVNNL